MSAAAPGRSAIGPLRLALWFGLAGGFAEAALYLTQRYALGRYLRVNPQLVWMSPVSEACLLLIPGLLLSLYARRRPNGRWWRISVTLCAFVAAFGVLLMASQIHELARVILALGVAVQAGRLATSRRAAAEMIVRRTWPVLASSVVLVALAVNGSTAIRERRALASLPSAEAGASNVLLLILDTVRSLDLSLYGYARRTTPSLERWGARGVVFERAISPAPWTLPSHASIFTGRDAHELEADWRAPLDTTHPTLAEALRARGYATGGFAANLVYTARSSGLARGFAHYEDYPIDASAVLFSGQVIRHVLAFKPVSRLFGIHDLLERRTATDLRPRVSRWIGRRTGRPFFAFVNLYDAHNPYLPPAPWDTLFAPRVSWRERNLWLEQDTPLTPAQAQIERDAYDAAVAFLDHEVGLLLGELEASGHLRNTIVIIASDHGEEFGEHGLLNHGNSLYLQALHVPLLIVWPGHVPAGKRIATTVSLRDIAATTMDLLGGGAIAGRSLRPLWMDSAESVGGSLPALASVRQASGLPSWFPVSQGNLGTAINDSLQLIRSSATGEALFDLTRDPTGVRPAADSSAPPALRARLPVPR